MIAHRILRSTATPLAALTLAALALSGCGIGVPSSGSSVTSAAVKVQGTVMGGSAVIAGANIVIWETDPTNAGYPSATVEHAKVLAGSTSGSGAIITNSSGGFSITTQFTCDPGTFLYATSTGGTTGAQTVANNNLVLASALGACSNFPTANTGSSSNVHIAINEATTIAVAYALGNFTYVDDTNVGTGLEAVYIGAPAKNNATTGSCTGVGSAMTCSAAGLAHAFQNAINLVNSVGFGSEPTGGANSTIAGNSLGYIPVAQVNLLANIVQYCTNSAGGSGTGGAGGASDGSNCGNFFSNAKAVTCSTSTCVPQDTLTAAITMGQNPEHNIANLSGYASGVGNAFNPSLSGTPQNLSVPITYMGSSTAFLSPAYLALDANDDVYVLAGDLPTPTGSAVFAMQSNGTPVWNTTFSTSNCVPAALATDAVGNVWATNDTTSTGCGGTGPSLIGYNQSTGAVTHTFTTASGSPLNGASQPNSVAVDQYNNVWFDSSSSSPNGVLYEVPYSGGSATGGTYAAASTAVESSSGSLGNLGEILFDGKQNVWVSTTGGAATSTPQATYVFPNTNAASYSSATAPAYTQNTSYSVAGAAGYSYGLALDGSGNLWDSNSNAGTALTAEYAPTLTSGVITGIAGTATTSFKSETKVFQSQFDGNGQFILTYASSSGEFYFVYNPLGTSVTGGAAQSVKGIIPCYISTATNSSCSSTLPLVNMRTMQIDSTGAIWVAGVGAATSGTGNGGVVQVLGLAAPAWPQLSYAHYSAKPQ